MLNIIIDEEYREALHYPEARTNPEHEFHMKYKKQTSKNEDIWDGSLAKNLIERYDISSKLYAITI